MNKKRIAVILITFFVLVVMLRLYFAFQTEQFSSDSAYFNLRQIENIKETGFPLFKDDLSYSGRDMIFLPLFHYILAFFSFFLPLTIVAKVIPNLIAASLIFVVYMIMKKISGSELSALITALLSGFIPAFFAETINKFSLYSFTIPLSFLLVYFLLTINEKRHMMYYILTFVILLLSHPSVLILVIGFVLYLSFVKFEKLNQKKEELEIILFSLFVSVWFFIIVYKKMFLFHGINSIWQNVPSQLFSQYFAEINILTIINQIGIFSFIFGIYTIYRYIFRKKDRNVYILISLALTLLILISLKLLTISDGVIFLSVVMLILFGCFIHSLINYVMKTKFENYLKYIVTFGFILVLLTMFAPAVIFAQQSIDNAFTQYEVDALLWIKENTDENAVIVAFPNQGNFITAIAERKNVIDSNYLLIDDIDERYDDINRIYVTRSVIEAIDLLDKYDAKYIYFSTDRLIKNFRIAEINYLDDKCFVPAYAKNKVLVYESRCTLEIT